MVQLTISRRGLVLLCGLLSMVLVAGVLRGEAPARAEETSVPVVYIATGENFPDALAASSPAAIGGGPVLLVQRNSIPSSVKTELLRLKPGKIVIVGGSGVVGDPVEVELAGYTTGTVERLSGPNRFETAVEISKATFPAAMPGGIVNGESRLAALEARASDGDANDQIDFVDFAFNSQTLLGLGVDDLIELSAPRAAFAVTADAPEVDGAILSTEITAPAPGVLLLNAAVEAWNPGAGNFNYSCLLVVGGTSVLGSEMWVEVDANGSNNNEQDCITTGALVVPAGTHTVEFHTTADGNLVLNLGFFAATLSALWVPRDGTGAVPVP